MSDIPCALHSGWPYVLKNRARKEGGDRRCTCLSVDETGAEPVAIVKFDDTGEVGRVKQSDLRDPTWCGW